MIQYVYIVTGDDLDMFCLFQRLYFLIGLEICFYIGMQPADDVPELSVSLPVLIQVDDTTGFAPSVLSYLLGTEVVPRFGGSVMADEVGLPVTHSGLTLPCGSSGRWEAI